MSQNFKLCPFRKLFSTHFQFIENISNLIYMHISRSFSISNAHFNQHVYWNVQYFSTNMLIHLLIFPKFSIQHHSLLREVLTLNISTIGNNPIFRWKILIRIMPCTNFSPPLTLTTMIFSKIVKYKVKRRKTLRMWAHLSVEKNKCQCGKK